MTRKSTPAHSENLVGADAGRLNEGVENKKSPFELSNREDAKKLFGKLSQKERDELPLGLLFAFADRSLKVVSK